MLSIKIRGGGYTYCYKLHSISISVHISIGPLLNIVTLICIAAHSVIVETPL